MPISSNDESAKRVAASLIDRIGFDTLNAGSLTDSWRFEPEAAAFTRLHMADTTVPNDQLLESFGASRAVLRGSRPSRRSCL